MQSLSQSQIVIYQTKDGKNSVEVQLHSESLWLSLQQIADLFDRDKSVISRHLKNVFKEGELEETATVANFATVQSEGERSVSRNIDYYNLDAILSVGYRVNSKQGTKFRQWATSTLKEHLVQGWTLNRQRFEENARELEVALELVRKAAKNPDLLGDVGAGLVDVITRYITQKFYVMTSSYCRSIS